MTCQKRVLAQICFIESAYHQVHGSFRCTSSLWYKQSKTDPLSLIKVDVITSIDAHHYRRQLRSKILVVQLVVQSASKKVSCRLEYRITVPVTGGIGLIDHSLQGQSLLRIRRVLEHRLQIDKYRSYRIPITTAWRRLSNVRLPHYSWWLEIEGVIIMCKIFSRWDKCCSGWCAAWDKWWLFRRISVASFDPAAPPTANNSIITQKLGRYDEFLSSAHTSLLTDIWDTCVELWIL